MRPIRVTVNVIDLDTYVCGLGVDSSGTPHALGAADIAEARRIHNPLRRRRFMTSRAAVRELLGPIAGESPRELAIGRNRHGKPQRKGGGPHCSLSRSGRHCAVATSTHPVGVDIEAIDSKQPSGALIEHFLPSPARRAILAAPPAARPREFAMWWCRIEAAVKAWGIGLDSAADCLATSYQQTALPDAGLSVAAATSKTAPFDIRWQRDNVPILPHLTLADGVSS